MAFRFHWPDFDDSFVERARCELERALNRGSKPSNICDTISVKRLFMGSQPPELDILEIGELTEERLRGIFKITYAGDAQIVLQTKVQANPLCVGSTDLDGLVGPAMLAADSPLIVPLELQISQFRLRGICVLIVSLLRGVTLSFKNEPLESVLVHSTFDNVPSIRKHLQCEIEQRLRDLFKEELPFLVHTLSMEPMRRFAERVPPLFRPPVPLPGQFRHRRSHSVAVPSAATSNSQAPSGASSGIPSRTHSPLGSAMSQGGGGSAAAGTGDFDEVYYFRRRSMIHRTLSRHSVCDPLLDASLAALRVRRPSIFDDLAEMAERIPLVGEEVREYLDRLRTLRHSSAPAVEGLRDPVLFGVPEGVPETTARPRLGSQRWVINSGSLQLDLAPETLSNLRGEPRERKPSVYKAPRVLSDSFSESLDRLSLHDPEEFRSLDSLASSAPLRLAHPRREPPPPPKTVPFGPAAMQRAVARGSLPGRLGVLRSLQENSSPFAEEPGRRHIVHRSHPSPASGGH